jgi:hypothetical protein
MGGGVLLNGLLKPPPPPPPPFPSNFCYNGNIKTSNISTESHTNYELKDVSHMQIALLFPKLCPKKLYLIRASSNFSLFSRSFLGNVLLLFVQLHFLEKKSFKNQITLVIIHHNLIIQTQKRNKKE